MNPTYVAAAIALGFVAYVITRRQPVLDLSDGGSGGGEVSTDDGEGAATGFAGIVSQAEDLAAPLLSLAAPASWNNPADLSADGLEWLMSREGFAETAYPDHKGYSIGYGHLIKPGESFGRITREQGAELLASDVAWAVAAVRSAVLVPLSQEQFDALVSLCFNIGAGAFKGSTLVRLLNDYDYDGAAAQFGRWIKASGQDNPGLIARRASERDQFIA